MKYAMGQRRYSYTVLYKLKIYRINTRWVNGDIDIDRSLRSLDKFFVRSKKFEKVEKPPEIRGRGVHWNSRANTEILCQICLAWAVRLNDDRHARRDAGKLLHSA